jgi:hypothetical protein
MSSRSIVDHPRYSTPDPRSRYFDQIPGAEVTGHHVPAGDTFGGFQAPDGARSSPAYGRRPDVPAARAGFLLSPSPCLLAARRKASRCKVVADSKASIAVHHYHDHPPAVGLDDE